MILRASLLVGLFSLLASCVEVPCGQTTVTDSYRYRAFIKALDEVGAEYTEIGDKTFSYTCSEADAVERAGSIVDQIYTSCGAHFFDTERQADFISRLDGEGISYWFVPTDEGERMKCNPEDKERVSALFQKALRKE